MLRKISTIDFKSSNTTSGKTVLIRVDYNVPVENELVTDDYRILKSIPTIKYCLDQGAKVVLMSHMGRPKGKVDSKYSLIPAGEKLAELLEMPIKFSEDCISEDAIDVSKNLKDGEIVFVGVEDVVFTPSGTTLNDAIHEIDCQTQANGTFKVTIFGDFIDEPAHTPISTSVELICASAYLVDKNNPDLKIRS